MDFKNAAESYNFYKNTPVEVMESRCAAIAADVKANPDANIASYKIELEGIEAAKEERASASIVTMPEVAMTASKGDVDDPAASVTYRSAFFKTLQGKTLDSAERAAFEQVSEQRAATFSTLSNSAAVIPTTTLNEVVSKARKEGGIIGVSRAFNMPSNIAIPVATPGTASWHTEGAAVDGEKADPAKVTFGAYEIMRILSISAAVQNMSVSAFESYLVDELTSSVMATIAQAMSNGTGTGEGTGIIPGVTWGDANSVTIAKTASLKYADVVKAIGLLKRGYANGAKFAMNNATLYGSVYGLVDDNGRPIFVNDATESGSGRILGFEVVVDDFMADDDILFGNFAYNGYNMPSGIAIDVSRDSSFNKGLVDYRAMAIADCKPIVGEAFVKIGKATS